MRPGVRHAARLARRWATRRLRRRTVPHGAILMYHRVAAPPADPWHIAVSPANFAAQMQALTAMAEVVPLHEFPRRLRAGRTNRPVVAVTFDDAYVDNLTAAKPVLDALDVPATVFVPSGWVGSPRLIWWDRLAHALLAAHRLPERLALERYGIDRPWDEPLINAGGRLGGEVRQRLHRTLWARLRELSDRDRDTALDGLIEALGTDEHAIADARVMTVPELERLTADGRVTIGCHCVTHPSLPSLEAAEKAWQIEESARQCAALFGARPAAFAYPYGDLDEESVGCVRKAGFALACSTREDLAWAGDDPLTLPRITVLDWRPAAFRAMLGRYWLA